MAIIKKSLGNVSEIIVGKFRKHYHDGEGGIRYDAFCNGWKEAWEECNDILTEQLNAAKGENIRLKGLLEHALKEK